MTNLQARIQDILAEFSQKLVQTFAASFHEFAATGITKTAPAKAASSAAPAAPAARKKPGPKPGAKKAAAAAKAAAAPAAAASAPAPKASAAPKAAAPKAAKGKAGPLKLGSAADGRRLPAETEQAARRFADYVKAHPGQRIREIGKGLGMTTQELALPVIKALKSGWVTKSGERSATSYQPAKKK